MAYKWFFFKMKLIGILSFVAVILTAALVFATDRNENLIKEREIYQNLRCLMCEGQSVAESESEFAKSIRSYVNEQVERSVPKDAIYNDLRLKYGDEIFFKPPVNTKTIFLWILPFFLIFVGFITVVIMLRKKNYKYVL